MAKNEIPLAARINRAASLGNIPQSVLIELTHACNLACYYCYCSGKKTGRRGEVSASGWKRVLGQLSEAGCLYVTFSGGEPFLRKDLFSIIAEARKLNFAVSLITNGTLLTGPMAKQLARFGLLDVGLSFHAANADLHDGLAGKPGSFRKTLETLRMLKSDGVKIALKHTVSKLNYGEFKALAEMAKNEGVLFEGDSVVVPHGKSGISPYALSLGQHRDFLRFLKIRSRPFPGKGRNEENLHCDAGRSVMGISANGDVYPCIQLSIKLGNIRKQSIKAIWSGKRVTRFREEEEELSRECRVCGMKMFCGRCAGLSFLENGDWQGKAPSICRRTVASLSLKAIKTPGKRRD